MQSGHYCVLGELGRFHADFPEAPRRCECIWLAHSDDVYGATLPGCIRGSSKDSQITANFNEHRKNENVGNIVLPNLSTTSGTPRVAPITSCLLFWERIVQRDAWFSHDSRVQVEPDLFFDLGKIAHLRVLLWTATDVTGAVACERWHHRGHEHFADDRPPRRQFAGWRSQSWTRNERTDTELSLGSRLHLKPDCKHGILAVRWRMSPLPARGTLPALVHPHCLWSRMVSVSCARAFATSVLVSRQCMSSQQGRFLFCFFSIPFSSMSFHCTVHFCKPFYLVSFFQHFLRVSISPPLFRSLF